MYFPSYTLIMRMYVHPAGGEDQGDLPHAEHVQLGHDQRALPDSRVLVSCGRPGRNTAGSHQGNCELHVHVGPSLHMIHTYVRMSHALYGTSHNTPQCHMHITCSNTSLVNSLQSGHPWD